MGFQASNILFSFSIICSFLLTPVRHAWGSNGSVHEALDGGCDVLGWRGLRLLSEGDSRGYPPASFSWLYLRI